MGEGNANTNTSTNTNAKAKKKRKGATTTRRNGTRSAAPPRARDLIEATGRYLSRFCGATPAISLPYTASTAASTRNDDDANPAATNIDRTDGDASPAVINMDGMDKDDDYSRLLCARFFPTLLDARSVTKERTSPPYGVGGANTTSAVFSSPASASTAVGDGDGDDVHGDGVGIGVVGGGVDRDDDADVVTKCFVVACSAGVTAAKAVDESNRSDSKTVDHSQCYAERFMEACFAGETAAQSVDRARSGIAIAVDQPKSYADAERFIDECFAGVTVEKTADQSKGRDTEAATPSSRYSGRGTKNKKGKKGSSGKSGGGRSQRIMGGVATVSSEGPRIEAGGGYRSHAASETFSGGGEAGVGEQFLKNFRAAKLHYEVGSYQPACSHGGFIHVDELGGGGGWGTGGLGSICFYQ